MSAPGRSVRGRTDMTYLSLLAALGLGFAIVPLIRGELYFFWDNARMYFPQAVTFGDGLRRGSIPQWSFSSSLGYPMLGEGQAASYHPFHLLLSWLFPSSTAFMLEIGLYLALSGVLTYLFLRSFRTSSLACLLAGLTSMLGGFSVVSVKNIAQLRSLWALPLALLIAERFVTGPRRAVWLLLGGLAFGLQLLSGNPHFAAITAVASGLYVIFRAWHRAWSNDESLRSMVRSVGSVSLLWVLAPVIGFGVAAIQIVPQLLHAEQSTRAGGMGFDFAMAIPANLRYLGQLLLPYAYEQGYVFKDLAAWGGRDFNDVSYRGIYMGVVPILLAALAIWRHRRWPWPGWALLALGVVGTALALGKQTPLYPALWSLPVFGSLRFPYRFLGISAFVIACLAGLGMAYLLDPEDRSRSGNAALSRSHFRDVIPVAFVLALTIAWATYLWLAPPSWLLRARDFGRGTLISLVLMTSACALVFAALSSRGRVRRVLCVALVVFTVGDLWWFRTRSGYAPAVSVSDVMTPPPVAEFLRQDDDRFRIMSLERWETAGPRNETIFERVQVHASGLWGIESADPYESLMLRRYFMVHEALSWELLDSPASAARLSGYLGALNVKYVVAPDSMTLDGWDRVYAYRPVAVWRNPAVLPRAFVVGEVMPEQLEERTEWAGRARLRQGRYPAMVRDWETRVAESQIVDNILERPIDYARTAIVAGSGFPELEGGEPGAEVSEEPAEVDEMRFSVNSNRPGFLVVSNNYYPGWTATINGDPTPIHRANWVTSGVFVPAGRSDVIFRFRSPGLRLGTVISLLSLLGTISALGWVGRRSRLARAGNAVSAGE